MKIKFLVYIVIFLKIIILSVANENNNTEAESNCLKEKNTCFNNYNSSCIELTKNINSWDDVEEFFETNAKKYDLVNINQINCGTEYENCYRTEPTKGIKQDCTEEKLSDGTSCCYMTVSYDNNKKYSCYPIKKDKNTIKNKIKKLKQQYDGSKKITIDCYSAFLENIFIRLLIIIILFI